MRILHLVGLALGLSACQPLATPRTSASPEVVQGLSLAQHWCSGCHAIEGNAISPNPDAPPFGRIVNQQGLTKRTLKRWLRDAHNYPDQMKFKVDEAAIDELVEYMVTLRNPGYRPPI